MLQPPSWTLLATASGTRLSPLSAGAAPLWDLTPGSRPAPHGVAACLLVRLFEPSRRLVRDGGGLSGYGSAGYLGKGGFVRRITPGKAGGSWRSSRRRDRSGRTEPDD